MLIGISGKIGSGKDTLADNFIHYFGHEAPTITWNIKRVKFADKLKDILCLLTGCTRAQLEDPQFKASNMPPEWNRWAVVYTEGPLADKPATKWLATEDEAIAAKMRLAVNGISESQYLIKEFPITYRTALQEIGTDLFRDKFHPRVWGNATFSNWKPLPGYQEGEKWQGHAITMGSVTEPEYPDWIVTDVRFPDEVVAIHKRGGIVLRINRWPETVWVYGGSGTEPEQIPFDPTNKQHMDLWMGNQINSHPSETALDNYDGFDEVIDNNGTLEDLKKVTIELVKKFNLK